MVCTVETGTREMASEDKAWPRTLKNASWPTSATREKEGLTRRVRARLPRMRGDAQMKQQMLTNAKCINVSVTGYGNAGGGRAAVGS